MQVGYSLLITEFPRSDINVFPDIVCFKRQLLYGFPRILFERICMIACEI